MFTTTKHIAATLMAIMLLTQIGLAQHSAVHFTDYGHYEQGYSHNHIHTQDDHEDHDSEHQKNTSESCQICLLSKSIAFSLTTNQADFLKLSLSRYQAVHYAKAFILKRQQVKYNPRAPPVFLI